MAGDPDNLPPRDPKDGYAPVWLVILLTIAGSVLVGLLFNCRWVQL